MLKLHVKDRKSSPRTKKEIRKEADRNTQHEKVTLVPERDKNKLIC